MQSPILRYARTILSAVVFTSFSFSCFAYSGIGPDSEPVANTTSLLQTITCPSSISVDCDDLGIYMTYTEFLAAGGDIDVPDECTVVEAIIWDGDDVVATMGCLQVLSRSYIIETDCGNFGCGQTVLLTDSQPPVFTYCPADTTILPNTAACEAMATLPSPTATDDCDGAVTFTDDAPAVFAGGTTIVTFTATDACGNTSTCQTEVTVPGDQIPTIDCSMLFDTIDCPAPPAYGDIATFQANGGVISDPCNSGTGSLVLSSSDVSVPSSDCPTLEVITRTYTITNTMTNESSSCDQVFAVIDTVAPTFIVPADALGVACELKGDTSITGAPTMIEDCTETTVTFSDDQMVTGGLCSEGSITRTWYVEDVCGNVDSMTQQLTFIDTMPPTVVCQDVTVYIPLGGSTTISASAFVASQTDNCSSVSIYYAAGSTGVVQCNDASASPKTIDVIVEDYCNNSVECTSMLTILDTIAPELIFSESDTVFNLDDVPAEFTSIGELMVYVDGTDKATLTDNCESSLSISVQADTIAGCPTIINREYILTQPNLPLADTATQTIVVIDNVAPIITCPADIVINETDICDTLLQIEVEFEESSPVTVTTSVGTGVFTSDTTYQIEEYFQGGDAVDVQFIVTDQCNNADTCTVNVQVASDPVFTCPPATVTYSMTVLPDYPDIDSFFIAGGEINMFCDIDSMSFTHDAVFEVDTDDACNATVTETLTIANMDGTRTFTEVKTTDLVDTEPPVLDCSGQTIVLASLESVEVSPGVYDCVVTYDFPLVMPTATDNFSSSVTITAGEPSTNLDANEFYWYAEDACGLRDTCTVLYILTDIDGPISNDQLDTMAVCSSELPGEYPSGAAGIVALQMDHADATIFDCKLDSSSFNLFDTDTLANGNIVRQYEVSDSSGTNDFIFQTLIVTDSEPPSPIVGCTDTTLTIMGAACELDVTLTAIYAFDNCSADSTTNTYTNNLGFDNGSAYTFAVGNTDVVWTITDANGNDTTCTQTVTVLDGEDPVITTTDSIGVMCSISNVQADASYTLTDFLNDGGTVSDNCGLDSTSFSVVTTLVGGSCPEVYSRTFTIADSSGREATFEQEVEVHDQVPPTVTPAFTFVPVTASDSLCGLKVELTAPTATDACGVETFEAEGIPVDSFFTVGLHTVLWIATDSCGLMDTAMTLVQVDDNISPNVLTPVDTSYYSCDTLEVDIITTPAMVTALNGEIYDACGYEVEYLGTNISTDGDTLIRQYQATDPSGNFEPFVHVVINDDGLGIAFDAPADTVLQCPVDSLDLLPTLLGDIRDSTFMNFCGMSADTIYFEDREVADSSLCVQSYYIKRIWTVLDSMGVSTRDTQLISVVDTVPPVFDSSPAVLADVDCDGTWPTVEMLTATDGCDTDPQVTTAIFYDEDICSGYVVTYRWYAEDECGNRDSVETVFTVLPDTDGPTSDAAATVVVPVTNGCELVASELPVPAFMDDCSNIGAVQLVSTQTTFIAGGSYHIQWSATDGCLNDGFHSQTLIVTDTIDPSVICKSSVSVNINNDSIVTLPAAAFYKDPKDNCGIDRVEVRRTSAVCGTGTDEYGDFATFCCADVGSTVEVEVVAIDIYGNESPICIATAVVSDKLAPSLEQYLPNVTVSCEYPLNTNDLSAFGTYVFRESDRTDIIADASINPPSGNVGRDGLFKEQCGGTVVELDPVLSLSSCGTGTITRRFEVADLSGNDVIVSQTVTVVDIQPFTINRTNPLDANDDVIWPGEYSWPGCASPAPDTSVAGAPVILNEDKCSQVAVNFKDAVFQIGNGGCAYIERTWTVIDWCQYDSGQNPNPGRWTYVQDIYVDNVMAPTFDSAELDTIICAPNTACVGVVNLSRTGSDDCTAEQQLGWSYEVDYDLDGSTDLTGSTSTFNRIVSRGTHSISWTLSDLCGNHATITDTFTVRDCKAPTAVCYSGLSAALDNTGTYELWASDVNNYSSDNCTSQPNLLLSFSSDVNDNVRVFDASHIGGNTVELWVTDEDGNQTFCTSVITIQQNLVGTPATVMGSITTAQGSSIADSKVTVTGAELLDYSMSDLQGGYAFVDIETESDIEVSVTKDGDANSGVNTLDIVKIQRHILGLETFQSPYQTLAADANDDERVTAADLLALRKLVLGVYDELPDNEVWRFVNAADMRPDVLDPWPYTEEMIVTEGSYVTDGDFVGVKIGDVDNSIDELLDGSTEQRSQQYYGLLTSEQRYLAGGDVLVPLTVIKDMDLQAMQLTISYDHQALTLESVTSEVLQLTDQHINTVEGAATLSWNDIESLPTNAGEKLLTLRFSAKEAGTLSSSVHVTSAITKAIAFDADDEEYKVSLDYLDDTAYDISLYQNRPNPFFSETVVEFDLPEQMAVDFKIFDASGRVHWSTEGVYPAGTNSLLIGSELAGKRGVFYLKMDAAEFSQVIKMIKIE